MYQVPLHSLIVMVGPSGAGKSTFVKNHFKPYEVVSSDALREELTGDFRNRHVNDLVFKEFHHRIEMKLKLGERVVADATHIRKKDRIATANIGTNLRVPVFYIIIDRPLEEKLATAGWRKNACGLIERHAATFQGQEKDICNGDNMATVIDTRTSYEEGAEDVEIVQRLNFDDLKKDLLSRGHKEFAVIGDVHGMTRDFQTEVDNALNNNRFIIQLGDIVDYGPDSVGCVDLMYKLVTNGQAAFIIGNHERKLEKYLEQRRKALNDPDVIAGKKSVADKIKVKMKGGALKTLEQLERLGDTKRELFETRFAALMNYARHHVILDNNLFVHASSTPTMWKASQNRLSGFDENRAVFGEVDGFGEDGFPNRLYNWVDDIPEDHYVFVGHAILDFEKIISKKGRLGGVAYFIDTGSGKAEAERGQKGILSTIVRKI